MKDNNKKDNNNLRNYTTITIARTLSRPVMFKGLPLHLAIIHLAGFVVAGISALILTNMNVNIVVNVAIPLMLFFVISGGVSIFYKKYGINGYYLKQRDISMKDKIKADKPISKLLIKNK